MSQAYKFQTLEPVDSATADPAQLELLSQAEAKVGFVPNMYRAMVNLPSYLEAYFHGYALFRDQSGFNPTEQEVVFLAISKQNGCNYCTAAHSTLAAKFSGVPADVLDAIRSDSAIADGKLAALYALAVEINNSRGRPDSEIVQDFLEAGYSERDIMAITLAVSVKVLSNYSNHYFETPLDEMFSAYRVD
ncbi:MAG: carboxymuconolactone decarboxylase family protein [Gammaproteobacteria bacterium]|nr:carboxymuconolactone decarboxylase family protein [Gammaproteobacteria bacterium]